MSTARSTSRPTSSPPMSSAPMFCSRPRSRIGASAVAAPSDFRFHHVSTDEVFGALADDGSRFTEDTRYDPRSPYSATKAASDHLVRAWAHTYGLPVVLSNCSNNYGPHQFVEKLIPLTILKCLAGEPIPVYGRGANIRDWLFVEDHAEALTLVLERGRAGRDLQHRRRGRAAQHRRGECDLRCDGPPRPAQERRAASRADHLRSRSPRARLPLRHRFREAERGARLDAEALLRIRSRSHREVVHRQPRLVGAAAARR